MKTATNLVAVFITMPIWYFLMYTVLSAVHVDRLVWFLFWIYLPFSLFVSITTKFTEGSNSK